jgi:hypothetical protein
MLGLCGNSSIKTYGNYHETNENMPSTVPLVSVATANEQTSDRNNNIINSNEDKGANYIGVKYEVFILVYSMRDILLRPLLFLQIIMMIVLN